MRFVRAVILQVWVELSSDFTGEREREGGGGDGRRESIGTHGQTHRYASSSACCVRERRGRDGGGGGGGETV